ncbi:hypothetical protein [Alteromonas sp. C1M14]|uniref:hypothetical protein n=1 Tax=Alteromonas sp. C1M14 TaxID=2841567 RepID=UPI001C09A62D|nr:hypothetical protein [Alteromonas sp. C1M14]MBU2978786.1 hypothetical protein [Alteromonas sp. C1M14]
MEKIKSSSLTEAFEKLNEAEKMLFFKCGQMIKADNGNMYQVDLLAIGAFKRTSGNAKGFKLLVESKNMAASRSLLRVQLDTFLRFSAIALVDNANEFASKVLSGEQIRKLKDSKGKQMSDAYLVKTHSKEYDWLQKVYDDLCGYIHFSNKHIFDSFDSFDDESRKIEFSFGNDDHKYPEYSWVEIADCFTMSLKILFLYIDAWVDSKANKPIKQD